MLGVGCWVLMGVVGVGGCLWVEVGVAGLWQGIVGDG